MGFTGIDANLAITRFFGQHGGTLPELAFDAIALAVADTDGLKAITTAIEGLFASREDLNEEGRELLRGLAEFAREQNFYSYGASGRATEILAVLDRMGAGGKPVAADDPAIEERFVPAPPEPEPLPQAGEGGE